MDSLNNKNYYELTKDELEKIQEDFEATYSTEDEVLETIKETLNNKKYLMDPHTATTFKYFLEKNDNLLPIVAYSTAEWTKFSTTIAKSMGLEAENDKIALKLISEKFNAKIPQNILEIFKKKITHLKIIEKSDIIPQSIKFLKS